MAMISKSPTNKSGNPPTNVSIRFRVYSPPYITQKAGWYIFKDIE